MGLELEKAYYEVSEILKYMSSDLVEKIPIKIRNFFEENKAKNYNFKYNLNKSLDQQEVSQETNEILTILYRDYICDQEERTEIDKILDENEKAYQEELRKMYNPKDIFKNSKKEKTIKENPDQNNVVIIECQNGILKKIISKLKNIFKIH